MILKGSQRGGGAQIASYLLTMGENDHVHLHDLRGFASGTLKGAMAEVEAISRGTRCDQYLFSLSVNPPPKEYVSETEFEETIERIEQKLGLEGQPRAVVFHEKKGRRHAHVVWSRIDAETMKAINLPFFKARLNEVARELFLEHGWNLPEGFRTNGWKNPLNFTLEEWHQAERVGLDPREIKQLFRQAWERSDDRRSFAAALEQHGYALARGDRRGFVAVGPDGEVHSIARYVGLKTKDIDARLGDPKNLPSVEEARRDNESRKTERVRDILAESKRRQTDELAPLLAEREVILARQRRERALLARGQEIRWKKEHNERQSRFRHGVRGVLEILIGRAAAIRKHNERDAYAAFCRDREQRDELFKAQMDQREEIIAKIERLRLAQRQESAQLACKIAGMMDGRAPLPALLSSVVLEEEPVRGNRDDFSKAASRTGKAVEALTAAGRKEEKEREIVILGVLAHTPRGTGFFPTHEPREREKQVPLVDKARMEAIQRKRKEFEERTRLEPHQEYKVEFKRELKHDK